MAIRTGSGSWPATHVILKLRMYSPGADRIAVGTDTEYRLRWNLSLEGVRESAGEKREEGEGEWKGKKG